MSLPSRAARRVHAIAKSRRTSASRVIADLIESGLDAKEAERRHHLCFLERLRAADDPAERRRLTEKLARRTFGE
ncbi:MAG: hypothetical protein IT460_15055 [Planctomycetes bacterium]|nr:hypothetical protein [Planctomycetota bacterium]